MFPRHREIWKKYLFRSLNSKSNEILGKKTGLREMFSKWSVIFGKTMDYCHAFSFAWLPAFIGNAHAGFAGRAILYKLRVAPLPDGRSRATNQYSHFRAALCASRHAHTDLPSDVCMSGRASMPIHPPARRANILKRRGRRRAGVLFSHTRWACSRQPAGRDSRRNSAVSQISRLFEETQCTQVGDIISRKGSFTAAPAPVFLFRIFDGTGWTAENIPGVRDHRHCTFRSY